MKKVAVVAALAAFVLAGCCSVPCMKPKCYPYPLYNYSPAKVCATPCTPACPAPCPVK